MIIKTYPKRTFDEIMRQAGINDESVHAEQKTCFISILDTCDSETAPWFKSDHDNVVRLFFDDVDREYEVGLIGGGTARAVPMSYEQAKTLVMFVISAKERGVERFAVHCTAGIARSGAVAMFISGMSGRTLSEFLIENPHTLPNGTCMAMMTAAYSDILRENIGAPEQSSAPV